MQLQHQMAAMQLAGSHVEARCYHLQHSDITRSAATTVVLWPSPEVAKGADRKCNPSSTRQCTTRAQLLQ